MKKVLLLIALFFSFSVYADEVDVDFYNNSKSIKNNFSIKRNEITFDEMDTVASDLTSKSKMIINNLFFNTDIKSDKRLNSILEISDSDSKQNIENVYEQITKISVEKKCLKNFKVYDFANKYIVVINCDSDSINLVFNTDKELIGIDSTLLNNENISNLLGVSASSESTNSVVLSKKDTLVTLKTYSDKNVIYQANGFYISDGVIVTSWKYISNSIRNGSMISLSNNESVEVVDNIIAVEPKLDLVYLKVKQTGNKVTFGSISNNCYLLSVNNNEVTLVSGSVIETDNFMFSNIYNFTKQAGSPLYNGDGEVVGILNYGINNNFSIYTDAKYLIEMSNKLNSMNYDDIKSLTINFIKNNYYVKKTNESKELLLTDDEYNEIKFIGNLESTIDFELVKSVKKDNITILRYKNKYSNMISAISKLSKFREALDEQNYKEVTSSNSKIIYKSNEYIVTALEALDYLIVIFEEVK